MSGMTVTVDTKKRTMTIVMPLQDPSPSASGKTLVVASSRGNVKTNATIDGRNVTVGVNAYIPKE